MTVHLNRVGLTKDELMLMMSPLRNEDGSVSHESSIMVNMDKLQEVIKGASLTKQDRLKIHYITVKMIDIMNELGINQYLPDKFKPILAPLFAMTLVTDGDFIGRLQ